MKAIKRIFLLSVCIAVSIVANAQSEQWKEYLDICKQLRDDMTACEKMELFARIDSLFDGYIPVRSVEMNYMEAALQCGDTATFKRLAFRVVRWKGWNPLVFYYTDQYKFLKDCDWWTELDSIQQAIHGRKDYSYAETLYQLEQKDQAVRRAFNRRSATDSGANYHRYELDAWNHAYPLLQKMTDELTKGDYEGFFALLWREVERGNIHAEDYASLYDRTYYRLYGKDWYGNLAATDKQIRTAKPKTLNRRSATVSGANSQLATVSGANERRRAACLHR